MEQQQLLGGFGADVVAVLGQDRREPGGFARQLHRVDLGFPAAAIEHDDPDESGPNHEPDDEQPDVEFRVHSRRV